MQKSFHVGFVLVAVLAIISLLLACSPKEETQKPSSSLTPITEGSLELIFQDDFRENTWKVSSDDDVIYQYANEEYVITCRKTDLRCWARTPFDVFENGVIEVDARTISNFNSTKYAILFREKEGTYYSLTFDGDFYSVERHYQDKFSKLLPITKSAYIKRDGGANRLKVACLGNTIEVYVNNQRLATITDDTFAAGKVALAVEGKDCSVAFDNFRIYRFTQEYVQKAAPSLAASYSASLPSGTPAITITPGVKPKPTTKSDSLDDILDQAAAIKTVKYVVVTTMPGKPPLIGMVWVKGSQTRMETEFAGVAMLVIQDSATSTQFNCLPLKQIAAQSKYEALNLTPVDLVQRLRGPGSIMTGSEKLDGKDCAVADYTAKDGTKMKGWVWKENGLVLKTVSQGPGGQEVIEIKSVSFDDIPGSQFNTPANVRLVSEADLGKVMGQSPPMFLTRRYVNSTWGYSILLPETWIVSDSNPGTVLLGDGQASLGISMMPLQGTTLDTLAQANRISFAKPYPDYKELSSQKISLSDGTPAVLVICAYTAEKAATPHKEMKVMAVRNNTAIILVASTTGGDPGWTKYGSTLGTIMDTMSFSAVAKDFGVLVDLGNAVEEAKYNVTGWDAGSILETPTRAPWDTTARSLGLDILGKNNSLDIVIKNADTDYVLTMEVADVTFKGEFDVYVNGWGPVFLYRGVPQPSIIAVHQFRIPKSYITGDKINITFRHGLGGYPSLFYVKLTPLSYQ